MKTIAQMEIEERRLINVRVLIEHVGSKKAFAQQIDREPSQISHFAGPNPSRPIGKNLARYIEKCCGVPRGWLDEEHDDMRIVSQSGDKIISPEQKQEVGPGPELASPVPLLPWSAVEHWLHGGVVGSSKTLQCPVSHGKGAFALEVRGASMEPAFHAGQHIFVDPDRRPTSGCYVVAQLPRQTEPVLRRLIHEGDSTYLEAINPAWPDRFLTVDTSTHIIGVVFYVGQPV